MRRHNAIAIVLILSGLASGQAYNPSRVNVVTTPWSTNWLTHPDDAAGLTDLGYSAWEQSLIGSVDLSAWLTAGGAGAPLVGMSNDPNNGTAAATLQQDWAVDVRWCGAVPGDAGDDGPAIQEAADLAAAVGGTLCLSPGVYSIQTDIVVDPNVQLLFAGGAVLDVVNDVNVTIPYPAQIVAAERQHIFSLTGTGAVWFGGTPTYTTLLGTVSPCWWGAVGNDSADDTAALQAAMDAAPDSSNGAMSLGLTVRIPWGAYRFSNLDIPGRTILRGEEQRSTLLRRIVGSTGVAIEDKGYAIGIHLIGLDINGMACAGDGLQLGITSNAFSPDGVNVWGWNGLLDRVRVYNCDGYGIQAYTNGNTLRNIQVTSCTGSIISGIATHIIGWHDSSCVAVDNSATPFGLKLMGQNHRVLGFHGEGNYSTGAIYVASTGTSVVGADCTVGEGKTLPALVYIASNRNDCSLFGLSAYAYEGAPDGIITALIVDDSYSAQRVLPGSDGASGGIRTKYVVEYFAGRNRNDIRNTGTTYAIPGGSWLRGDRVLVEASAGLPATLLCTTAGTPGTWAPVGIIPGAVPKTADYHISGRAASNADENGKRFANTGAAGTVTLTLPADAAHLEFEFASVVNGQVLRIDPNDGTDHFIGQANGKYLELGQGELVRIGRINANEWYITRLVGTPSYEP